MLVRKAYNVGYTNYELHMDTLNITSWSLAASSEVQALGINSLLSVLRHMCKKKKTKKTIHHTAADLTKPDITVLRCNLSLTKNQHPFPSHI